jgi:hypothetical protein
MKNGNQMQIKRRKIKNAGLTLLFAEKANKGWIGYLNSYVVKANNWDELFDEVLMIAKKEIFRKDNNLMLFLGIADVFYVSGSLKQFAILGKTYYDEYTQKVESKKLVAKKIQPFSRGWQICELVYFYNDDKSRDFFALTCLTLVKANTIKELKEKLKGVVNLTSFKHQIVTKKLDKLNSDLLEFIGIKKVNSLNGKLGENPFESYIKDVKLLDDILTSLPKINELKKKQW